MIRKPAKFASLTCVSAGANATLLLEPPSDLHSPDFMSHPAHHTLVTLPGEGLLCIFFIYFVYLFDQIPNQAYMVFKKDTFGYV